MVIYNIPVDKFETFRRSIFIPLRHCYARLDKAQAIGYGKDAGLTGKHK